MTRATDARDASRSSYLFGDFVLDGARRELRRNGASLPVEPKVLDLLLFLVAHRDRAVSRDELFTVLWRGQHVGEEALGYCVKAARRAVADSGEVQHTIATVRGHGYRFVAHAHEQAGPGVAHDTRVFLPEHASEGFFVGRERVMARLRGALAATVAGHGRVVLLVGEPGIGKTRSAEELLRSAVRQGVEVLVGRCHEGAGAPPFWPWVQVLRSWIAVRDRASVVAAMGDRASELALLVPDLAALLGVPASTPPDTDDARFRLFDAATSFLVRAAGGAPLVLLLDDLHWADTPSLLLLQFLARELHGTRLLVVGTMRDTDVGREHPLVACVAALARSTRLDRIELEGLSASDVGLWLEATTGEPPPGATVRAVHEQTGGNPFFVGETVRLLLAEGAAGFRRGEGERDARQPRVPGGVREVVRQRLAALGDDARHVLRVASVFGTELDAPLVLRVAEVGRKRGRAALLAALDEAVRAHLIEPRDGDGYRFAHGLVRETIYDDLSAAERAMLHQRVGAALAAAHARDPGPQLAALAHHFAAAAIGGDARGAIRWAIEAGDRAASMLAWEDAAFHHARALALLEREPALARTTPAGARRSRSRVPADGDAIDRLLFALGESLWKSGELPRAKEMLRRAASRARADGSPARLARAALGLGGGFRGFELGEVEPELIDLLEEALGALPRRASGLRARVMARLAVALYHVPGSLERRRALSAQAVEMAAASRDTAAELAALYARHGAIWGPDTLDDRIATATTMLRLATRVGDREAALHAHRFHLIDSLELGDAAAVDADLASCTRLGEELRQPYYLWYAATVRATRALLDGRLADSERLADEALLAGRRAQSGNVEQVHASQLLWIRREQGRVAEVEPVLRDLVARFPSLTVWRCAHALALAELGRLAEAREHVALLAPLDPGRDEVGGTTIARDAFWLSATCALAETCAELGDGTRAASLHGALLPYAGRIVQVSIGAGCLGAVDRTLGRLAALRGRRDDAVAHFDAALRVEERLRAPLLVARTRRQRAAVQQASGARRFGTLPAAAGVQRGERSRRSPRVAR